MSSTVKLCSHEEARLTWVATANSCGLLGEGATMVQSRQSMHAAKLLSDDELCALEDLLADYFGLLACVEMVTMEMTSTSETAEKVRKLVVLSEQMASDRPFARQCKRRFV